MKILVAEDDQNTRDGLVEIFEKEGYQTLTAPDGNKALETFEAENPDIVCLDIMMPGVSGYDVCKAIRAKRDDIPIIFISAKSEEIDKVLGLELGADDYIIKPFGVREVVARIRAVSRRYLNGKRQESNEPESFMMLDLKVVPGELRAYRNDQAIDLSLRDVKILQLLHEKEGQAVDRDTFFDVCWSMQYIPSSRTLDQHISQLRKKVELNAKEPLIVKTVQGVGYQFEP